MINKFIKSFLLFFLVNMSIWAYTTDDYLQKEFTPVVEPLGNQFVGDVQITVKYTCNIEPNNLNSFDLPYHPVFLIEMPNFDVYNILSLHFKDENLQLVQNGYDNGQEYEILNKHTLKIIFYNDSIEKIKRFPKDLEVTSRNFNDKFIVRNVIYDKKSFIKLEENLKECQKLVEQKKARTEQPANRLRNFFGADMK